MAITCKFSYQLGLAQVVFSGVLTRALNLDPETILRDVHIQNSLPDGRQISGVISEVKARELFASFEKHGFLQPEQIVHISPKPEEIVHVSPKTVETNPDTRSFWEKNKRTIAVASALFFSLYCVVS